MYHWFKKKKESLLLQRAGSKINAGVTLSPQKMSAPANTVRDELVPHTTQPTRIDKEDNDDAKQVKN